MSISFLRPPELVTRALPWTVLAVRNDKDGTWFDLKTTGGREVSIHVDMFLGSIPEGSRGAEVLDKWCQDREDESGVKNERRSA